MPISFDRPGRTRAGTSSAPAAASSGSLDLSAPTSSVPAAESASLDLSAPAKPSPPISFERPGRPPAPNEPASNAPRSPNAPISFDRAGRASPPPFGNSLDLSTPSAPAPPVPRPGATLDLSAAPAAPLRPARTAQPAGRQLRGERVPSGRQHLLNVRDPTVVLTRLQSGIGELTIEAVASPDVGDLRLGAAYELHSGTTSTVQLAGGNRFAPSSRRPVIVASHDEYEQLGIDLRQVRDLKRLVVYAFSESRAQLTWGGTLVITTSGGARIELPLESLYAGRIAVLISIYRMAGELVIRAEMETIVGDVREAARAYGFDRITWRDDRTPVD